MAELDVAGISHPNPSGPLPDDVPPLRLEWRSPAELAENPSNWRRHPETQLAALTGVISEVGWAGACLFNETTGRLIDGHARRKVALDQGSDRVPVLIGRWTPEQEAKILATLDPISSLAEADSEKLDALLREVTTDNDALAAMLDGLAHENGLGQEAEPEQPAGEEQIPEKYQVLIEFNTEQDQAAWLEKLTKEGLRCRSLIS